MSSHVPSPTSSPASGAHESVTASQENIFRASQSSNPDSSFESSFQLDSSYLPQYEDTQRHPKGKRKRTTSQDKILLEAAYNANPKPDKAARLDLVKRVTLNEKEVQIWFQNRRQNDRRKSRPLSPQEIAQLRFGGGLHALNSESLSFGASNDHDGAVLQTRPEEEQQRSPSPNISSQEWPQSSPGEAAAPAEGQKPERRHSEPSSTAVVAVPLQNSAVASGARAPSPSFSSSVGYLSNRWNADTFSAPSAVEPPREEPLRLEAFAGVANLTTSNTPGEIHPLAPSKSSSQFRLSLSLEGKAEIVSSLQSPPRPAQPPLPLDVATLPPVRTPRGLQRSISALPGITLPPISSLTAGLPPQLARGRSKHVSAWESCCDSDTRDELTKLAEHESSGSAVAAISLLRSSSQTSLINLVHGHTPSNSNVLRPNSSKRNAAPTSRRDAQHKKPKLARSSSSVPRLQSLPPSAGLRKPEKVVEEYDPEKKGGKASLSVILSPTGDSDKENWSPDEDGNPFTRRRPLPSIAAAAISAAAKATNVRRGGSRILGDTAGNSSSSKRMLLAGRANTAPVPRLRGGKAVESSMLIFEDGEHGGDGNDENEAGIAKEPKRSDEEVERFMRGEVSPSKKGDVDCVAGLLALSQGNWR